MIRLRYDSEQIISYVSQIIEHVFIALSGCLHIQTLF